MFRKLIIITVLIILCIPLEHSLEAYEAQESEEYLIKTAFIFNFAKFVEWPVNAFTDENSPIILGILGADPFANALDSIEGKTVNNRTLVIKRCQTVEEAKKCHILFISSQEKTDITQLINMFRKFPILTVGDTKDFCSLGGIINFVIVENKVRFEISLDSAQMAGLKISSKLLKLAMVVSKER